ncbi:E3 ubiquitin-protein ligase FANCL [Venturia canescens]|uniref:E3 ubiquitin-protein ligase FANCL n=1 Tax=Venturia canescens TaxID=32260 RepID=UPI001C9C0571|nr:E3 ubiquitin-protein ligase FANCL [Venturia canescens]
MEESAEIIKSHPGLVLVSEHPVTWKGFLVVDTSLGFAIDITLTLPFYPQLTDANLFFGQSISLLHGTDFTDKILRLLENATTVSSLLFQLKRIVTNLLKEKFDLTNNTTTSLQGDVVDEIREALRTNSPVKVSASNGLKAVKLSLDDVVVIISKDSGTNMWKVISSDLPELPMLEQFELNLKNLSTAMEKLHTQVNMLEDAWNVLHEIDNTCWVVDPRVPKPYHLYRRVNLTSSLSALITIDPINFCELPDIKLLGSDSDVAKYRNIMSRNLMKWDPESAIADNLRILFAIDELPQPPEEEKTKDENAIVEDDECSICFAMELDEHTPPLLPVEICSNEKCRKHFHTMCLRQWLQAIASNQVSFDRIHGTCPNCSESISCSLVST